MTLQYDIICYWIFVEPACGERDIVATMAVEFECMCVRACVRPCMRPSGLVRAITPTCIDGF